MDATPPKRNSFRGPADLFAAVLAATLLLLVCGCQKIQSLRLGHTRRHVEGSGEVSNSNWGFADSDHAVDFAPSERRTAVHTVSSSHVAADIEPAEPHLLNTEERLVFELTVTDAIATALEQNRYVKVQRYSPQMTSRQVVIEDSYFHPLFQIGAQYTDSGSQISNVVDGPGTGVSSATTTSVGAPQGVSDQFRVSQKLRSGGEVWGALSSVYTFTDPTGSFLTLNPSYRSTASVQFSHPFLRGAGHDVAMTGVWISSDMNQAERCQLEVALASTAFETASIYWELVEARSRLDSRNQGVKEAASALEREEEKLQLGASSTPEVAAVREQLERFRVNQSLAEGDMADAERRLRTAMGLPREDGANIRPVSRPSSEPPELDWSEAVDRLCDRRPEIRRQQYLMQAAIRGVNKTKNGLLPDIQGYIGGSVSGTEGDLRTSLDTLSQAEYGSWWAGVVYQRQLGRCADKASHHQAQLNLAQNRASFRLTKDQAMDELHGAYQSALNGWRGVQLTEAQRVAATRVLDARREMHDLGAISLQDYLMSLTQWNQALTDYRTAISNYNTALIKWEFIRGTMLDFRERPVPVTVVAPAEVTHEAFGVTDETTTLELIPQTPTASGFGPPAIEE